MRWSPALLVLLALGVARAQTQVDEEELPRLSPPAPPSADELRARWASSNPDRVLDEAERCVSFGDFECADLRLDWLAEHEDSAAVTYQSARSLEFQERYEEAAHTYETVLLRWPDTAEAVDAGFRRALCLDDLGRAADALSELVLLEKRGGWSDRDALTLALAHGVAELHAGRTRKGIRHIQAALPAADARGDITWIRAKTRAALARHLLDTAAATEITGNKRAARALKARAALINDAELQITAIARLGEPEFALAGLLMMGDAYMRLYDDMIAAPPPRRLDEEQRGIYTDMLLEQARILRTKAWRYYDEGVALAARTRWQGHIAADLRARRDAAQ